MCVHQDKNTVSQSYWMTLKWTDESFRPLVDITNLCLSDFWALHGKTFLFGTPFLFNTKWISVMIWMKMKMGVRMCFSRTGADWKSFSGRTADRMYSHMINDTHLLTSEKYNQISNISSYFMSNFLSHFVASKSWNSEQKHVIKRWRTAVYSSSQRTGNVPSRFPQSYEQTFSQ